MRRYEEYSDEDIALLYQESDTTDEDRMDLAREIHARYYPSMAKSVLAQYCPLATDTQRRDLAHELLNGVPPRSTKLGGWHHALRNFNPERNRPFAVAARWAVVSAMHSVIEREDSREKRLERDTILLRGTDNFDWYLMGEN